MDVVQRIWPGKELLQESLKLINQGATKNLTRGHLVASLEGRAVAEDIRRLLTSVGEARPKTEVQRTAGGKAKRGR